MNEHLVFPQIRVPELLGPFRVHVSARLPIIDPNASEDDYT